LNSLICCFAPKFKEFHKTHRARVCMAIGSWNDGKGCSFFREFLQEVKARIWRHRVC
jgi:hypothetical protein